MRGLPLFDRVEGAPLDVEAVAATASGGVVFAVEPEVGPKAWVADPGHIFLLDQRQRTFLSGCVGLHVAEPPVRVPDTWRYRLGQRLRRGAELVRAGTRRALATLRASRPLPTAALDADERQLLGAIVDELETGRVSLPGVPRQRCRNMPVVMVSRGALPARLIEVGRDRALAVPRNDPTVRRMIAAYAHMPANIYPIMAALLDGHDVFGSGKRDIQQAILHPAN